MLNVVVCYSVLELRKEEPWGVEERLYYLGAVIGR